PPAADEIFMARDSLRMLEVAVGDMVGVITPGGQRLDLRVAATVYDPSLSPSEQEKTARAYVSTAALATSSRPAVLDQLKIKVADQGKMAPSRNRDTVVAVAGAVGTGLQGEYGLSIREVQVPEPYKHPHQWQADSLLLSLLAGGTAALLLSTILVANMLNSLFTQQIPQIGIMKAIGGRSGQIARLYLAMTLLVAATATALAFGPAVLAGQALASQIFAFLGIQAGSLTAPWWAYVALLVAGLGLPPTMALLPLVKASRTTVRAAIDHHGLSVNPSAASGVLARLSRFRVHRGLLLALRNTVRAPARFVLSVGLLASAGTVFVAGMSLSDGVGAITQEQNQRTNWDVDVQLAGLASPAEVAGIVAALPDVSRVESMTILPTGVAGPGQIPITRTYPDQGHGRVSLLAITDGSQLFATPTLLEGRWLGTRETGSIVLNQVARNSTVPNVHAGGTVQLTVGGRPTSWRVVGVAEEKAGVSNVY